MEYLFAFLILLGIVSLTTILAGIFKLLVPIAYIGLGYYLGNESLIMGIGASLGAIVNVVNVNRYIRSQGAMSSAPILSKLASFGLIIAFILGLFLKGNTDFNFSGGNGWLILLGIWVAIIAFWFYLAKKRSSSISTFKDNVIKYKIVEKYDEDPKWATYLYFKDGREGWNETIPGSFMAKDPESDLTFVHNSKEEAEKYASGMFENAEYIDD